MGIGNFKKQYGFTQGRFKLGADHIKKCVEQVDINNANNIKEIVEDIEPGISEEY